MPRTKLPQVVQMLATAEMPTIFVDGELGSDNQDDGTISNPFRTINAAIAHRTTQYQMNEDVRILVNGTNTASGRNAAAMVYEERLVLNIDNFRRTHLVGYGAFKPEIRHSTEGEYTLTASNLTPASLADTEADAAIDWTLADTGISWDGPDLNNRSYVAVNVGTNISDFYSTITNIHFKGLEGAGGVLLLAAADNASFNFLRRLDFYNCEFDAFGPSPGFAPGLAFAAKNFGTSRLINCHVGGGSQVILDCCVSLSIQGSLDTFGYQFIPFGGQTYIRATRGLPATEGDVLSFAYTSLSSPSRVFFEKLVVSQGSDADPLRSEEADAALADIVVSGDCFFNGGTALGSSSQAAARLAVGGDLTLADTSSLHVETLDVQGNLSSTSSEDCTAHRYHVQGDVTLDGGGSETWNVYTGHVQGDVTKNGATWNDPNGTVGGSET